MRPGKSCTGFAAATVTIALSVTAAAQGAPGSRAPERAGATYPGYAFGSVAGEVVLSAFAVLSNTATLWPRQTSQWGPDAPHPYDRSADRWSDATGGYGGVAIGFGTGYFFESAHLADAGVTHGAGIYALHQTIVEAQATLFTRGVVELVKRVTARCRPRFFVNGACSEIPVGGARSTSNDAFPSGHTAPMGAMAGSRLVLAGLTSGPAGYRWASFGLAEALALTTGILRVEAGAHSWSDVVSGFLIGHAIGVLVAFAHPVQVVDRGDWASGFGAPAEGGFALRYGGEL